MRNRFTLVIAAMIVVFFIGMAACQKNTTVTDLPIVGHWGCEQYVSHRVDSSAGIDRWDTSNFIVEAGSGYEVYFYSDGSGKLVLNNTSGMIKRFSCNYEYDSINQKLTIYNTAWIISAFSDATRADLSVEELTPASIRFSWMNHFSEPVPFFERFFMRRID